MQVTNITVRPIANPEDFERLRGYANIALDNQLAINDIKIIEAERGMCIEFPRDKDLQKAKLESIALLNRDIRKNIQHLVLKAYRMNADYFLVEKSA